MDNSRGLWKSELMQKISLPVSQQVIMKQHVLILFCGLFATINIAHTRKLNRYGFNLLRGKKWNNAATREIFKGLAQEVTGAVVDGTLTTNMIEELMTPYHKGYWSLKYYDDLFSKTALVMSITNEEIRQLIHGIMELEDNYNSVWIIAVSALVLALVFGVASFGALAFIIYRTRNNYYHRQLQHMINAISQMRAAWRQRNNLVNQRDHVIQAEQCEVVPGNIQLRMLQPNPLPPGQLAELNPPQGTQQGGNL